MPPPTPRSGPSEAATDGFYAGFTPDPALPARLAALPVPTLLVAGEYDIWPTVPAVRELARLFADAEVLVHPAAGHFPWVDDPAAFASAVERFLQAVH
ncbi:alpha/beta hydrolase [Micromonospora sp. NPDC047548]|uniref:alpha/beta fold hydrolase n=1 Tax=Micromonospora sp. NPDC047548 TaxID=3155624 RepID=UPI0033E1B996